MKRVTSLTLYFVISLGFIHLKANTVFMQTDTTINQLTKKEAAEGWQLLFDGNTPNGWRTFKNKAGSWKVENGMLCSYTADKGSADLITDAVYENFELVIDWKLSAEGNSGILYLVTEDYDESFSSGPEYQLIDDEGFPEKIENWQKTGANYAMHPPMVNAANKPGEWNTTKITIKKGHVEHWLNGKKIVDYDLWSEEWKKLKDTGKWKDAAGYAASKSGHIALQSSHSQTETSGVCFRNIKIRTLE